MLILQTTNGKLPIAKGNLYKIREENGNFLYITKDRIAIPFERMNGVKVETIDQALECIEKYADDRGLEPREVDAKDDEILETIEDWGKRMDAEYEQYVDDYVKTHPNKDTSLLTDTVKHIYNKKQTIVIKTVNDEEYKIKSEKHILHEDKDGKLCYIFARPYKRVYVREINGVTVKTVKQAIDLLEKDCKIFNKFKELWKKCKRGKIR